MPFSSHAPTAFGLTCNDKQILLAHHLDDVVRAGLHAGFTADTLFSVDLCNSIYHADRVKLTGICTVSHAQAAIRHAQSPP